MRQNKICQRIDQISLFQVGENLYERTYFKLEPDVKFRDLFNDRRMRNMIGGCAIKIGGCAIR